MICKHGLSSITSTILVVEDNSKRDVEGACSYLLQVLTEGVLKHKDVWVCGPSKFEEVAICFNDVQGKRFDMSKNVCHSP